ncbi:MAG: YidC/Oxa1 family membrane protein insertase [Alkalibacterium sp.]|nr:YidC/Oxa1 family membrane protein insertase [Alkalibacterium sp.]
MQTKVMQAGYAEETRKQSGAMMYMSPVMILMFSITGPAGLTLYWFAGGLVAIAQSLYTNIHYEPRLEKEMKKKHGGKPVIKRKKRKRKTVEATETDSKSNKTMPAPSAKNRRNSQSPFEQKARRNTGKQQPKQNNSLV